MEDGDTFHLGGPQHGATFVLRCLNADVGVSMAAACVRSSATLMTMLFYTKHPLIVWCHMTHAVSRPGSSDWKWKNSSDESAAAHAVASSALAASKQAKFTKQQALAAAASNRSAAVSQAFHEMHRHTGARLCAAW